MGRNASTLLGMALLMLAFVGRAQFDMGDDTSPLDALDGGLDITLDEGPATVDLSGLATSCYLPIRAWALVQPADRAAGTEEPGGWRWQTDGRDAVPLTDGAISTRIAVPTAGTYRVFLRERLGTEAASPVVLSVRPDGGEPILRHTYGATPLDTTMTGREHELKRPLIIESAPAFLGMLTQATMVWEYVDVELTAGVYELTLASTDRTARLTGLLLTQAKGFRPSMDSFAEYNTMDTVYLRFRVREGVGAATHTVFSGLNYHWRGRVPKGGTISIWGWNIGLTNAVATGEWTDFMDATEAMVPGPGPWSSCYMSPAGIERGILDIEVAWRPHPAAVLRRLETATSGSSALMRVPHGLGLGVVGTGEPVWGVWSAAYLERFVTEDELVANYFSWATDAMKRLDLPADHPMPKKIMINTSVRTTPAYLDRAAEMLAMLGVNWLQGASPAVIQKHDLYEGHWLANTSDYEGVYHALKADADKVLRVKVGDEISTAQADVTVNETPYLLAGFHDYLRQQAAVAGMDMRAFIGMDDVTVLTTTTELPPRAGLYERRLYYHSNIYAHLASVPSYKTITDGYRSRFPNIEVYNNYSPHPLFLTGATMNHSDWFVLCRNEAQSLAWAEDWAYYNGWDLGTAYQCTSYYAAMVAAAARRHHYPSGFYVGTNCGGSANKIYACVAQGLTRLHLYDWGPIDGWPEGSNSWSENQGEYFSVAQATHALGPADSIIVDGDRVPARIAILYNRSHEIWQGGVGQMNHDWMWTYIAANGASEPVDVVIEDDLISHIDQYRLLVIGGLNLSPSDLAAVQKWVEKGNTLVLTTGAAMYDTANDVNPATIALTGVRQYPISITGPGRLDVTFRESTVSPAATFAATFPGHHRFVGFEPTDATVIATWPDGTPAAATRAVGKGRVISLAFLPGHSFRDNGQSRGPEQAWVTGLLQRVLGDPVARLSIPGAETTTFTHPSGMAILLNVYHPPADLKQVTLTVHPDRNVSSVRSTLHGELPFTVNGDRIEVTLPVPAPVDTIIISSAK